MYWYLFFFFSLLFLLFFLLIICCSSRSNVNSNDAPTQTLREVISSAYRPKFLLQIQRLDWKKEIVEKETKALIFFFPFFFLDMLFNQILIQLELLPAWSVRISFTFLLFHQPPPYLLLPSFFLFQAWYRKTIKRDAEGECGFRVVMGLDSPKWVLAAGKSREEIFEDYVQLLLAPPPVSMDMQDISGHLVILREKRMKSDPPSQFGNFVIANDVPRGSSPPSLSFPPSSPSSPSPSPYSSSSPPPHSSSSSPPPFSPSSYSSSSPPPLPLEPSAPFPSSPFFDPFTSSPPPNGGETEKLCAICFEVCGLCCYVVCCCIIVLLCFGV